MLNDSLKVNLLYKNGRAGFQTQASLILKSVFSFGSSSRDAMALPPSKLPLSLTPGQMRDNRVS